MGPILLTIVVFSWFETWRWSIKIAYQMAVLLCLRKKLDILDLAGHTPLVIYALDIHLVKYALLYVMT